jgi:TonB-dependent receptor
LGNGRTFGILTLDDSDIDADTTVADFIGSVTANGNPRLEPFLSWNFDTALEWYPNEDSIIAVGLYYKRFNGGFENVAQTETFVVNGESFDTIVPVQTTADENSRIFGVEVTAAHAFSYLPAPFDGFGFKASYNYADSNFEFQDGQFGAATIVNADGSTSQLSGIIPSANLPGLSKHTANGQIYYNIGDLSLQGIVKYRSDYFQQFIATPLNLRVIRDATVFEARISYKINDNVKLSLEGVNLFNEPREHYNPTQDSFAEINVYGPRYFAGITAKF